VGVSAGGFIAAGLANGIRPREMCAAFIENKGHARDVFDPAWLTVPAYGEILQRARRLPGLAASTLWQLTWGGKPLRQALQALAPALPTGLFSSEEARRRLEAIFAQPGRSNDFRQLRGRLTLLATEIDTGRPVAFGSEGWDHVPVSRAVQATCALPGLFPPVAIEGRNFVDGALAKTMHASAALREGADLVLCINPLVPFTLAGIADHGLPAVLSQTLRTLIHSRLALAMQQYSRDWPGADVVLLEPDSRDPELFGANVFGYGQRRGLAEHAYQCTRAWLRANETRLAATLGRHGVTLRSRVLHDAQRVLVAPREPVRGPRRLGAAVARLHCVLDELDHALQAA
jgi:predicted acylesterase/phospholipase RssA